MLKPNLRFWSRVDSGDQDACWNWTGRKNRGGYGTFSLDGTQRNAHRVAWILTNGPIASRKILVCHSCDNRLCCNPRHLFLGTYKDNRDDAIRKGRLVEIDGPNNPQAKFSTALIGEVRQLRRSGLTHLAIANQTGISRPHITHVLLGNRRSKK